MNRILKLSRAINRMNVPPTRNPASSAASFQDFRPAATTSDRSRSCERWHCRTMLFTFLLSFSAFIAPLQADEPEKIAILPASIELTHAGAWQTVSAQWRLDEDQLGSTPKEVEWKIADEAIAQLDGSRVIAQADGRTKLIGIAKNADKQSVTTEVDIFVKQADQKPTWEFRNHVESVLSRNSCNMGACHGALAGKGGFRLSLRAYDPAGDFFNVTKQDRGRRIELSEPAKSLLVAKPIGAIEHKGGIRLQGDSHDYRVLTEWIAAGAPNTLAKEPKLSRVEVLPKVVKLRKADRQQIIVRAHYDNGRIEDVTHWAKYSATDEAVASVDEHGLVSVIGPGEGAVSVWFASRVEMSRVTVAFDEHVDEKAFEHFKIANVVDEKVIAQLRSLGLPPSDRTNDNEFLRRAYLCAIGTLPTAKEVEAFLKDDRSDKRERLVDDLLERPEYVDYWTYRWSDVLMLNSSLINPDAVKAYYGWLRNQIAMNRPWNAMVSDIVTARGESLENGATNFFAVNQDPENMTENACQAFMGLSIGCAKCHNHPLEKWTNDQYYAMANMFARVRAKGWGGDVRNGSAARTLLVLERGDLIQPLTGKPQPPAPLDAPPLDPNDPSDRRVVLADWLTSPDNPYFTKAVVNRIWAAYFGIGIVNSIDDMRTSNPASNPALLDALCTSLHENKFDLKSLMRLIMNSETFQRSSLTSPANQADKKYFSHYFPKRMMAEVLHDAVVQVSGPPSTFNKTELPGADTKDTNFYPSGTRAIQLYDSVVINPFLKTFGRNQRRITCECERSDEPSIVQVLHINNGDTINTKLAAKGGNVDRWMKEFDGDHHGLIRHAFLTALSREPTEKELDGLTKEVEAVSDDERHIVIEDLLWSLMSSREFLFLY